MWIRKKESFYIFSLILILILTFDLSLSTAQASNKKNKKTLNDIEDYYDDKTIKIQPQLNTLSGGFLSCEGSNLYYTKSMDSLFYEKDVVDAKIIYVDAKNDAIQLELRSLDGRQGWISFHINNLTDAQLAEKNLKCFIEKSLSGNDIRKVYFDTKRQTYHLFNNNHYTKNLVTLDQAVASGGEPDHICFKPRLYLPGFDREQELSREILGSVLQLGPISNEDEDHLKLKKLGEKILENWPIEKIGFTYSFYVVESDLINALAVPGGQIFITRGLLETVDSDLELEAILAHEIAHVEKRHSIRSMEIAIKKMREQQAMAQFAAAAAAMGAASSSSSGDDNYYRLAAAFAIAAIASAAFSEDYPYEQEQEADFLANLYFKESRLDINALHSVFQKLQFFNLTSINDPNPRSSTHPPLADRISYSQPGNFVIFGDDQFIPKRESLARLQVKPIYYVKNSGGSSYLYIYLNDKSLYQKATKPEVSIPSSISRDEDVVVKSNGKSHSFYIVEESKVHDQFGVFWLLKNEKAIQTDLDKIDEIGIEVSFRHGNANSKEIRFYSN
jgi:Zn-dependent protease with chaperone function